MTLDLEREQLDAIQSVAADCGVSLAELLRGLIAARVKRARRE
jgi:hypothetical protein